MKKLSILLASAAAMVAFTSCEADKEPVFQFPADGEYNFTLETPEFAQDLALTEENETEVLEFEAVAPDFGAPVPCTYALQVSLDENFTEGAYESYDMGKDKNHSPVISMTRRDLARILCNLHGFDPNTYEEVPPESVWVRTVCTVTDGQKDKNIMAYSNPIELTNVTFFHVIDGKRVLYLVGSMNSWKAPFIENADALESWKLEETEIGSNVYFGQFDVAKGNDIYFRFYTALGDNSDTCWGNDNEYPSVGALGVDNTNVEVTFDSDVYLGTCVPGKGSWKIVSWDGGLMNMTVDLNNMTVRFEATTDIDYSKYPCVFLVGGATTVGWDHVAPGSPEDYDNTARLYDINGDGIYENVEPIPLKADLFRIYYTLGSWGEDNELPSIGSVGVDNNSVDVVLVDNSFGYEAVPGKGSWKILEEGMYNITIDLSNLDGGVYPMTITKI